MIDSIKNQEGKKYLAIARHYEDCLARHGDTHLGVDWPNFDDTITRHKVMFDLVQGDQRPEISILDFGCGASHFYEFIQKYGGRNVRYTGLDISEHFVELSRSKYPHNSYICVDLLDAPKQVPMYDYIVANGVFTEKRSLSFEEMLDFFQRVATILFQKANTGIAFNVMAAQVDWQRQDLFHLPLDTLAGFLVKKLSRHFTVRRDYGLYEYTVYVYKEAQSWLKL